MTELVALAIARLGSLDSAAAMVAISAPTMEKITTTMPEKIAPTPCGKNPPCAVRLLKSIALSGHSPARTARRGRGRRMIAATLIPANQNSNSPKITENRFVAVISDISTSDSSQSGASSQYWITLAPATASKPTTITQKYQYSQPTEKPAQPPMAVRA